MTKILEEESKAILLLGDIGVYGFSPARSKFPSRVLNVGVLEQTMVGVAAGLSIQGMIPTMHTISPFIVERAFEQIKLDLVYQRQNCNIVTVGGSFDYALLGATHHCPEDVSVLLSLDEITIYCPANGYRFSDIFETNYQVKGIKYFRLSESESTHPTIKKVQEYVTEISNCDNTPEAIVFSFGHMGSEVAKSIKGLNVRAFNSEKVWPFDPTIFSHIPKNKKILVVEPWQEASSSPIFQKMIEDGWRIKFLGYPRGINRTHLSLNDYNEHVGLTAHTIREKVLDLVHG